MASTDFSYESFDVDYRGTNILDINGNEKYYNLRRYGKIREFVVKDNERTLKFLQNQQKSDLSTGSEPNFDRNRYESNLTRIYQDLHVSKLCNESFATSTDSDSETISDDYLPDSNSTRIFRDSKTSKLFTETSVDETSRDQTEVIDRYHLALKLAALSAPPIRIFRDPKTSQLTTEVAGSGKYLLFPKIMVSFLLVENPSQTNVV